MKKSRSTQELQTFFPSWSEIRNNIQSLGAQFFNTIAKPMDKMDKYLYKMKKNAYLSTVNLDEVDWVYRVSLPTTYSFTLDTTDQLIPVYSAPTVEATVNNNTFNGNVTVTLADENSLENMWYNAVPDRGDLQEIISVASGEDQLLHWPATSFPYSGLLTHHLSDGGKLWIESTSGTQYVSLNDDGLYDRGTIIIRGMTRKDTYESETLIFPWDMKQQTAKEWKKITDIETYNLEDEVSIEIRSADFDWGSYWSFYNLRWSNLDTKIDEFWNLGTIDTGSTLDLIGYISDEWQDLMLGLSGKEVKDQWELIDIDLSSIDAIDMAIQPFTDRAWVVDTSSGLHCFSVEETMVSGIDFLARKSSGSNVKIEILDEYYVIGDTISFSPLHARPIAEIDKYRVWYETPDGTKYGVLDGSAVSYSSDFWVYPGGTITRELGSAISITASDRGEYKIALEAVYPDGTTHVDRVVVPVKYKQPLSTIDITSHISGSIVGVDFDSDQYLWVKTSVAYYRFSLHSDLMIIDYSDKIIYFREDYTSVDIT
jgi:hypothetical protein